MMSLPRFAQTLPFLRWRAAATLFLACCYPNFVSAQVWEENSHLEEILVDRTVEVSRPVEPRRPAGFFGGAELLWIRPHFSEAVAFAEGTQTATNFNVRGRAIDFSYDGAIRAHAGWQLGDGSEAFQIEYHYFDPRQIENGAAAPGGFIIDPLGNAVGTLIDPVSMAALPSGDFIQTESALTMNVLDLTYQAKWERWASEIEVEVGARVAKIDQFYYAKITNGGAFFSQGTFDVKFTGAGPTLGIKGRRELLTARRLSATAGLQGTLMLGDYDVSFSRTVTQPALITAVQQNSMTRIIPVLESEVGIDWQATPAVTVSAGWLFQAWFDMGTSGGTFGGFFNGADDSNTMSFDGLFVRAVLRR